MYRRETKKEGSEPFALSIHSNSHIQLSQCAFGVLTMFSIYWNSGYRAFHCLVGNPTILRAYDQKGKWGVKSLTTLSLSDCWLDDNDRRREKRSRLIGFHVRNLSRSFFDGRRALYPWKLWDCLTQIYYEGLVADCTCMRCFAPLHSSSLFELFSRTHSHTWHSLFNASDGCCIVHSRRIVCLQSCW